MNDDQIKDMIMDHANHAVIQNGGRALWRATGDEKCWAETPSSDIPAAQARLLATLQRMAGSEHSDQILDQTWMETEKQSAIEFVNYVFEEYALWAMAERPDLLRTGRQIINAVLPPEEQI